MKNAVLFSEEERALPGPGAGASRQTTCLDKEASTVACRSHRPLDSVQRVPLHGLAGGESLLGFGWTSQLAWKMK